MKRIENSTYTKSMILHIERAIVEMKACGSPAIAEAFESAYKNARLARVCHNNNPAHFLTVRLLEKAERAARFALLHRSEFSAELAVWEEIKSMKAA